MKKKLHEKCSLDRYKAAVMESNYVASGEWFPTYYLHQQLGAGGFHTSHSRIADICNDLAEDGKLDKMQDEDSRGMARYRLRNHGRQYLSLPWRKKSNEEIGYVHPNSYC